MNETHRPLPGKGKKGVEKKEGEGGRASGKKLSRDLSLVVIKEGEDLQGRKDNLVIEKLASENQGQSGHLTGDAGPKP